MRTVTFSLALMLVLAQPGFSDATTLACRPGVTAHTYAVRYIGVFIEQGDLFHAKLGEFAAANGLSVSSVGLTDPNKALVYRRKTTFLQSATFGTVIEITTDNRKNVAKITVGNNCWAPNEDWRPYWKKLTIFLQRAGYRDAAKIHDSAAHS